MQRLLLYRVYLDNLSNLFTTACVALSVSSYYPRKINPNTKVSLNFKEPATINLSTSFQLTLQKYLAFRHKFYRYRIALNIRIKTAKVSAIFILDLPSNFMWVSILKIIAFCYND